MNSVGLNFFIDVQIEERLNECLCESNI